MSRHLPRRIILLYGLPGLATAIPTIPLLVFVPTFYAQDLGLGLGLVGLVLFTARLFDVCSDPVIGWLSDNITLKKEKHGRRKPWILIGSILGAIGLGMLLMPPSSLANIYWLGFSLFLLYLGWTMVQVPYTAWGAELSGNYSERSVITATRETFVLAGILLATISPLLVNLINLESKGELGILFALTMVTGLPAFFLLLSKVPDSPTPKPAATHALTIKDIKQVFNNKPFLRLFTSWFINGIANGLPPTLLPLFVLHVLGGNDADRALVLAIYFITAVLGLPLWLKIASRKGKHKAWIYAMGLAVIAFIWVPFLGTGDLYVFLVVTAVSGFALGADLALPPSMQADVIDLDTLRHNQQRAGTFFAVWSMGTKLALGLAVLIGFGVLELSGFKGDGNDSPKALLVLALLYAAVPCALKLMAGRLIWRFEITKKRQKVIGKRLQKRINYENKRRNA